MPQKLRSILVLAVLAAISGNVAALSRRDQAGVDALNQRMEAAENKYREAVVMIGNADPEGQKQSDAALEDMEDVVPDDACRVQAPAEAERRCGSRGLGRGGR
jgi:membrane-bound lytic murein transglycosylase D